MKRALIRFSLFILVFTSLLSFAIDDPVADPKAVVTSGQARFTVLTPQLVRMEWSANSQFEDHASMVFINRRLPVPAFKSSKDAGWLTIKTERLTLKYKTGTGRFKPDNLSGEFTLNNAPVQWHPGLEDKGNLKGTTRTLDGVKGDETSLEPGLVSRDGWVVVDDSSRPIFDKPGAGSPDELARRGADWPWVMPRPEGEHQDWYIFAHGHDYKAAMRDFIAVAGRIPIPPRFAFGTWWSRYWSYTNAEFRDLVDQFHSHDVPLDVLVIDMDWHLTVRANWWNSPKDQSGHTLGWTGYTWNRDLFPDPKGFLGWVTSQGLKPTMNLHPASGVQPHEEQYPEMARAMGIDPATKKYVPFDITNKKFAENYLRILHYPYEDMGVRFWWLDWQQEKSTKLAGVNPTWWLNYVHFTDMERRGKRGLLFHRWGGLGNHRYEIGFSGDTISVWESLAFQPYFTATAANVGYGYWSHDIGGHMPGVVSPDLYTRWIQFGIFSPILRTHTTKNPDSERRIWAYPEPYAEIMRNAYLLRYSLIPYIYTAARNAYETGVSLCRPMYYSWPEAPEAYSFKDQYTFGDDMIVAPVAEAVAKNDDLVTKKIWLPEGTWIEWSTGARLKGPATLTRTFAIDEYPVYVRAGAIVPMQPKMSHTGERPVDPLILNIFPGLSGTTRIYEDAGDGLGYKADEYTWTPVRQTTADGKTTIEISPAEGRFPGMMQERGYEIRLVGDWPAQSVAVNGKLLPLSAITYDGNTATASIAIPKSSTRKRIEIVVQRAPGVDRNPAIETVAGKIKRLRDSMTILNATWPADWSPDSLVRASQTGERINLHPEKAAEELEALRQLMPKVVADMNSLDASDAAIERALRHLEGVYTVEIKRAITVQ